MSRIPIVLTKSQQATTIANYLPGGKAFATSNISGTTIRKLLLAFADELMRADSLIALFRIDTVPDATKKFISEWEAALGIPDECFGGTGTDIDRRLAIVSKLSAYGVQTDQDFIDVAAKFGIVITVESGSVHGVFPYRFPMKLYASERDARFTIVIRTALVETDTFTYTFPISFGSDELGIIACIFNKIKPANVDVVFEAEI